jgi:hypothetical protein
LDSTTTASAGASGGEGEHALDAAQVELAGQRRHDDDEVDVGGEDLRGAAVLGRAHERAGALAHGVDRARLEVVGDPVADRGQVGGSRAMAQPAGDEAGSRAGFGDQLQAAAMHRGDAGERRGQRRCSLIEDSDGGMTERRKRPVRRPSRRSGDG